MKPIPDHSFSKLFNISFGFFGVQIAYALQSANISRIFSTLGADPHDLSYFWILPPLMGIIVQPIIGAMSDRTWTRFGRRIPYLFIGALVAVLVHTADHLAVVKIAVVGQEMVVCILVGVFLIAAVVVVQVGKEGARAPQIKKGHGFGIAMLVAVIVAEANLGHLLVTLQKRGQQAVIAEIFKGKLDTLFHGVLHKGVKTLNMSWSSNSMVRQKKPCNKSRKNNMPFRLRLIHVRCIRLE